MTAPLRVLVVDDSPTARTLLSEILSADTSLSVVGQAADGVEAIELTKRLRPSIVVMDINMPGMDGFEATKRIMIEQPTPIVIVTAAYDSGEVEISLQAVRAGALTATRKPPGPMAPSFEADAARLVRLVKALAVVKLVRHTQRTPAAARVRATGDADENRRSVGVVGVAASTGGPAALYRFLEVLPRTLDIPVLVVQHIAEGFVTGLARWLGTATVLPVSVAEDGKEPRAGEVYIAPDGRHLGIRGGRLELSSTAPVGGFRPSANVLFSSLADSRGPEAAAVVLTGMGNDGLEGAARLRAAGGLVLAQDADSSVVFGMPRAVTEAGLAHGVGNPDDLAYRIARFGSKKGECR
ncbi:MAG: chemotaxis protein CheB [Acidimicrobiales bacterium]